MNIISVYQDFKRIFGFCPCCGEPFRLSDCTIRARTAPPVTIFDRLDQEKERLSLAEERLDQKEGELRELAREEGRRAARKRLRSFMPFFVRQRIEIRDVKVLFHPVDYIAFRELYNGDCNRVSFIDRRPNSKERERIQKSIHRSLTSGNIEWLTVRVLDDGNVVFK